MNTKIKFEDLGIIDYSSAWEYQGKLMKNTVDIKINNRNLAPEQILETPNYFLFVEHPHVYTLGKSGDENNMLINAQKLEEIHATYVKTNRGGDITYHGFGQIVGYPILDLENFFTDIHLYMRSLEEVIILTMAEYGLKGERSKGETGVWLDAGKPFARKICAMGVKASRWVTMHGFAFNVNTDMKYFEHIIPCGIKDKQVTSLERELGKKLDMEEVKSQVKQYFAEVFKCEFIP